MCYDVTKLCMVPLIHCEETELLSFHESDGGAARPLVLSGEVPLLSPATGAVMLILALPLFLLGIRLCG